MNFAHSTNVYKIWADMIAFDRSTQEDGPHAFCAYAGRRDGKPFTYDHEAIMKKYGGQMKMVERIPDVLAGHGQPDVCGRIPHSEEDEPVLSRYHAV